MRTVSCAILLAAVCGCGNEVQVTQPLEALAPLTPSPQYEITAFSSSLGGTVSRGTAINNRGLVAGFSSLLGNQTRHAALWRGGSGLHLRTLAGADSSV